MPSHVLYCGADLFNARTPEKLGSIARATFDKYARTKEGAVALFGKEDEELTARVEAKLKWAAVSDIRIDFEDGYGARSIDEEKADAARTGTELRAYLESSAENPPRFGIRIRGLTEGTADRALDVLDVFYTNLAGPGKNALPPLVVTLPKVRAPREVVTLVNALGVIEDRFGGPSIGIELMAETKEAASTSALESWTLAGHGRVRSIHLGAYDFLSELGVLSRSQKLHHPLTDALRAAMKIATANTDVDTVDGATTMLPIPPHVIPAFAAHVADVKRSLDHGFFSAWILHPAQLVSHAAALVAFYRDAVADARARLAAFVKEAARANAVGGAMDDRATARGLVAFFSRGLAAGVLVPEDLGELEPYVTHVRAGKVDALVAAANTP